MPETSEAPETTDEFTRTTVSVRRPRRPLLTRLRPGRPGERSFLELPIAISIGVVTITGAVLTFLSIQMESSAVDTDRQAVVETVDAQSAQVLANMRSRSEGGELTRYRVLHAQAEAIQATNPQEALTLRRLADALIIVEGIPGDAYTKDAGVKAVWQRDERIKALVRGMEYLVGSEDQASATAALADRQHARSNWLALGVVGQLFVIVALTAARLVRPTGPRSIVFGAALAAYLAQFMLLAQLATAPV